jgi:hypothetical protein
VLVERFSLAESEATVTIAFLDGFAISANVFSMSHTISILQKWNSTEWIPRLWNSAASIPRAWNSAKSIPRTWNSSSTSNGRTPAAPLSFESWKTYKIPLYTIQYFYGTLPVRRCKNSLEGDRRYGMLCGQWDRRAGVHSHV